MAFVRLEPLEKPRFSKGSVRRIRRRKLTFARTKPSMAFVRWSHLQKPRFSRPGFAGR